MTSPRRSLLARWGLMLTLQLSGLQVDPAHAQGQEQLTPLEPFRGVTETGTIQHGLFRRQATGLVLQPMRQAALAFLAALTPNSRWRVMSADAGPTLQLRPAHGLGCLMPQCRPRNANGLMTS